MNSQRSLRIVVALLLLLTLAGCAAQKAYHHGERAMRRENYDDAVISYSKAAALTPGNSRYDMALARAKVRSADEHFDRGKRFAAAGQLELAIAEFQQVLLLLPGHQFAGTSLQRAISELRKKGGGPSEIEELKEAARRMELGPPKLDPRGNIPILLNFKDVKVGKIFEAIGKASGINFIFDDKTELEKPMTIDIGNVTLEKALDILMLQTKNFYKVIDAYTLLVAPDTRQKRQEYEDQVIRTFFLSNADTKQVVTLLRSLLQARQIAENEELNSITIKDTPDKVAVAERIMLANDKSKGEVLIDVELLEINRTTARNLGIDLSTKVLSLTFGDGAERLPLNNLDAIEQSGRWTVGVVPSVLLNFLKTDADTRTLAKPQLRVSEGEQAEILIGDRVPIPTTSFNTSQTIGGNIVPITSFSYQNVGITVQMEPRVHHNREITLKLQVEMSQLGDNVQTAPGQFQSTIGTRQIQTVIRLRDGETNMLAGLIQRTDSDSYSSVAGLGDIPWVRRLFGNTNTSSRETDLIMTLTPRIIRIPDITEEDLATLWVGTEENMQLRGPARSALNQGPFSNGGEPLAATDANAPVIRQGGALNRISGSDEVERDRQAVQREGARGAPRGDRRAVEDASGEAGRSVTPVPQQPDTQPEEEAEPPDEPVEEPVEEPPSPDERSKNGSGEGEGQGEGQGEQEEEREPLVPSSVRLLPSQTAVSVGDAVVVSVAIEGAQNVGSVPFHLRYDPAVLQFVAPATVGPFLGSDGTEPVFLASDVAGGGEVVVGLSRLGGGAGVSGSGVLAIFQFLAVGPGNAGFAFSGASVKDPMARNLVANFSVIPVVVTP